MVEQKIPGRGDVKDDINGDCCLIRLLCLVTITRRRCLSTRRSRMDLHLYTHSDLGKGLLLPKVQVFSCINRKESRMLPGRWIRHQTITGEHQMRPLKALLGMYYVYGVPSHPPRLRQLISPLPSAMHLPASTFSTTLYSLYPTRQSSCMLHG